MDREWIENDQDAILFKRVNYLLSINIVLFHPTQVVMATNRIETLDPALIRPGKLVYCIGVGLGGASYSQSVYCIVHSSLSGASYSQSVYCSSLSGASSVSLLYCSSQQHTSA